VTGAKSPHQKSAEWTIAGAEELLGSLAGVVSARVVAKPGGEVEEVHLLTTGEVTPKQTVRNVESALLAHFDLAIDHRKISVAQTVGVSRGEGRATGPAVRALPQRSDSRILFIGLETQSQGAHQVRCHVELEWRGTRHRGEAAGADLTKSRMEAVANATLRAIETIFGDKDKEGGSGGHGLALDGVKQVDAFDRRYVLVGVHVLTGRHVIPLSGSAELNDSPDRAVIIATLQAADRWVRGHI